MKKTLVGAVVGAAAAIGGAAWAAKRWFGSDDGAGANGQYGTEGAGGTMAAAEPAPRREGLDPVLLEILACPDDKQPVIYQKEGDAERLTCTSCGKRYPVRDGIPVMLIDEAQPGPVPTQEEIAAAKAVAPQGKPAIVGAQASGAAPVSSTGSSDTGGGSTATTTAGAASAASATSTERVEGGKSLDAGSGVG